FRVGLFPRQGHHLLGRAVQEERVDHFLLGFDVGLGVVNRNQLVFALLAAKDSEIPHGAAANFGVLIGLRELGQPLHLAADTHGLKQRIFHLAIVVLFVELA